MHSSLYGKIEKARRYAQEPQRVQIEALTATFQGEHDQYRLELDENQWSCSCHSFEVLGLCAHVMAVQRLLDVMLSVDARTAVGYEPAAQSSLIGKIEKAGRYAQQPERVAIERMDATFQGSHDSYDLRLDGTAWRCRCHTFDAVGLCAHVMAVQRILAPMLSAAARTTEGLAAAV
jgi:hypothetical protein